MGQWHVTGWGASNRVGWHMRVHVVCGSSDAKRVVVVAGQHTMGRWHVTERGASGRAAWHARVQVVRVVVVGSDRAGDPSMWVGDAWVRGMWVRERVPGVGRSTQFDNDNDINYSTLAGCRGGWRWATSPVIAW